MLMLTGLRMRDLDEETLSFWSITGLLNANVADNIQNPRNTLCRVDQSFDRRLDYGSRIDRHQELRRPNLWILRCGHPNLDYGTVLGPATRFWKSG